MYCDVIKTNHQIKSMFVSNWAAPWITYEAIQKAQERGYELFYVDSERQVKAIVKKKKEEGFFEDKS